MVASVEYHGRADRKRACSRLNDKQGQRFPAKTSPPLSRHHSPFRHLPRRLAADGPQRLRLLSSAAVVVTLLLPPCRCRRPLDRIA